MKKRVSGGGAAFKAFLKLRNAKCLVEKLNRLINNRSISTKSNNHNGPIALMPYRPNAQKAFTLAEVLITLGIIGIVAAMTIPTLIHSYRKQVIETKLKRFYSVMNQAIGLSEVDNGEVTTWKDYNGTLDCKVVWGKYFANYIKVTKTVESADKSSFLVYFMDGSVVDIQAHGFDFIFYTDEKAMQESVNGSGAGVSRFPFGFEPVMDNHPYRVHYVGMKMVPYMWAWDGERESLLNGPYYGCDMEKNGTNGSYCTKLIQLNNWKIPDDYPVKF